LKEHTAKIPFERSNQYNVIAFLEMYVDKSVFENMYLEIYKEVGLKHGRRVGAYINRQIKQKDFSFGTFADLFLADVQKMLLGQGGSKIVTVRQNYIDFLMELITKQYNEGKTTTEVTDAIYKYIRSREFYRWQGMRIARTETTTASNFAAVRASTVSGVVMEKVWVSAQDSRTRRIPEDKFDHYSMNGEVVLLNESFNVSGEQLEYPGDQQNGSAGNIINCRCTVAQRVKRDADGNIIRTNTTGRPSTPISTPQPTFAPRNTFVPAKTIGDAEKYALENKFLESVNYKGISLNRANTINKKLLKLSNQGLKFKGARFDKNQDQVFGFKDNELIIGNQINFKDETISKIIENQIQQSYKGIRYYNSSVELMHMGYEKKSVDNFIELLIEHEMNHYKQIQVYYAKLGGWGKETQKIAKKWYNTWAKEVAKRHRQDGWIPSRYSEIYVNDDITEKEWFAEAMLLYKRNPELIKDKTIRKLLEQFEPIYKLL